MNQTHQQESDTRGVAWIMFLAVWFSLVNPVLEELFWRVYLRLEMRDPCCGIGVEEGGAFIIADKARAGCKR